jgi:uncharacterized membrane protein YeaQ/YmgE (transglycosylase-associated protein family)
MGWVLSFLLLLVIAGICGALGQAIVGFSRGGCLVTIVLGFIGAVLGHLLVTWFNLPELFEITILDVKFPVVWSIVGSALFVAVISFLTRGRSA